MLFSDSFILGNGALHQRFCITTEILGALMTGSRPVTLADLETITGRSTREINKICQGMERAGLLQSAGKPATGWRLACEPATTTLEDVFRCVLAEQGNGKNLPSPTSATTSTSSTTTTPPTSTERLQQDVNLLIMQATMAINQSVLKHLRQFSLDLLKSRARGMFSMAPKTSGFY